MELIETNRTLEVQNIKKNVGKKSTSLSRAVYRAFEVYQKMEQGIYTLSEPQETTSNMIDIPQMPVKHNTKYENQFFSKIQT